MGGRRRVSEQSVLLAALGCSAIAVGAVLAVSGAVTAIKGSYALFGVLIAVIYVGFGESASDRPRSLADVHWLGGAVFVLASIALLVTVYTGERLGGLLLLPVGYVLVALQLRTATDRRPRYLLAQITALFFVAVATKYLATGFYWGGDDTLWHVKFVERLLETGTTEGLSRYSNYAGFHGFVGAVRLVTGVPAYDAVMIAGVCTYLVLVPVVFVLVRALFDDERLGLYAAMAVTLVEPILFYATYFTPQSFGGVLAIFLLLLATLVGVRQRHVRFRASVTLLAVATVAALILTHHLAIMIFASAVAILFGVKALGSALDDELLDKRVLTPRLIPISLPLLAGALYWSFERRFIAELVGSIRLIVSSGLLASGGSKPIREIAIGGALPSITARTALDSLFSLDGVYFVCVVAVFALGAAAVVASPERYVEQAGYLAVGGAATAAVMKTPLAAMGLERAGLIYGFFFAVVLAIGLRRCCDGSAGLARTVLALALVAALGTAPMVGLAGNDLYDLHAGPDLYELYPTPEPQKDFSESELRQLEATAAFVDDSDTDVSSFWHTKLALERFGVYEGYHESPTDDVSVTESCISSRNRTLVYRTAWVRHRVAHSTGVLSRGAVVIPEAWFDQMVATENKVYSAGEVGLLWEPEPGANDRFWWGCSSDSDAPPEGATR